MSATATVALPTVGEPCKAIERLTQAPPQVGAHCHIVLPISVVHKLISWYHLAGLCEGLEQLVSVNRVCRHMDAQCQAVLPSHQHHYA
jgi:hypothetical protein